MTPPRRWAFLLGAFVVLAMFGIWIAWKGNRVQDRIAMGDWIKRNGWDFREDAERASVVDGAFGDTPIATIMVSRSIAADDFAKIQSLYPEADVGFICIVREPATDGLLDGPEASPATQADRP